MEETGRVRPIVIIAAVSGAAVLGVLIAAAVTWLVWSQGWGNGFPYAPFVMMGLTYSAVSVVCLGQRNASFSGFAAAFFVGLVLMVIVGMTISEIIHCSFDRHGCISL